MRVWTMALAALGTMIWGRAYLLAGCEEAYLWFRGQMPVKAQIEVMEEYLKQVDADLRTNAERVVKESVSIDRLAESLENQEGALRQMKAKLAVLKTDYAQEECPTYAKEALETAMANQVARFKAQQDLWEKMRQTLTEKRDAFGKMQEAFDQQKTTRDTLTAKLAGLRAEYEAMRMRGQLSRSALETSASRKATGLYEEIRDRLEVERRLWEQHSGMALNAVEPVAEPRTEPFDIASVDAILNELQEVSVR